MNNVTTTAKLDRFDTRVETLDGQTEMFEDRTGTLEGENQRLRDANTERRTTIEGTEKLCRNSGDSDV